MNSVTQLAAVAVLALSGLGLYMVVNDSPPSDSEAPAAVIDPEQVIAKVTGTIDGSISASDSIKLSEYAWEHRGLQGHGSVTADDPRLSGSIEMSFDWDDFRPQARRGAATKVFGLHLENDEGAWDGVVDGIRWPDEVYGDSHTTGLLVGSGAYDGLSAFIFMDGADHSYSFEGLIFPGAMPE